MLDLKLKEPQIVALGHFIAKKYSQYQADREGAEQNFLQDKRQVDGVYGPEVEIPSDKSHVYPRDTAMKLKAFVAKLMELMFPATDDNFTVVASPVPNINEEQLNLIIKNLEQEVAESGEEITPEAVERAVKLFAKDKAARLFERVKDQLTEAKFKDLSKRILRSGGKYGYGISCGPMTGTRKERKYRQLASGAWEVVEQDVFYPVWAARSVFDIYPDMSATSWEAQEGLFDRFPMSRTQFAALAEREGFKADPINQYLKEHADGNYEEQGWETDQEQDSDTTSSSTNAKRRYEVARYVGLLTAHNLKDIGVVVAQEDLGESATVDIWFFNDVIIKFEKAALGDDLNMYYQSYIRDNDDDEATLLGRSLPTDLRDTQKSLCVAGRMLMDNAAGVAGPMVEVNIDLLAPNTDPTPHPHKTYKRMDDSPQTANIPAVRNISVDSHISEILAVKKELENRMDVESNLPQWAMTGDTQNLGEAARTTSNMSMLTSGANMIHKDEVRNFDRFVVAVANATIKWDAIFLDDVTIIGDEQVIARGATSLVAKEVRAATLVNFMNTLTPQESALIDPIVSLKEKLSAADLPKELMFPREEAEAKLESMATAASKKTQSEEALDQSKTDKNNADTEGKQVDTDIKSAGASNKLASEQIDTKVKQGQATVGAIETIKKLRGDSDEPGE